MPLTLEEQEELTLMYSPSAYTMPFKSIDKIDGSDTGLTLQDILTHTERARGHQFVEHMRNAMQSIPNISTLTVAKMMDILDRVTR